MRVLPFVAVLFIRLLHATLRVRHVRPEHIDGHPRHILAFWHECILFALFCRWRKPTAALISQSRDGEIVARVIGWFGAETVRGSSNRGGGQALRQAIRQAREGTNIGITPDGSRGPRRVAKDGIVRLAQATGLPIVAFYFTAERKKRLRSWDQQIVPKPFSRALFLYGRPIVVPRAGDVEEWRLRVEQAMNDLAETAERDFDALWAAGTR